MQKDIQDNQIVEVRQDGIVYKDDDGRERFIDFEQCYQDYLAQRLSDEAFEQYKTLNPTFPQDFETYEARVRQWREVAWRNIFGDKRSGAEIRTGVPYMIFHSTPKTRILFASKDEFSRAVFQIRKSGWATFDLS